MNEKEKRKEERFAYKQPDFVRVEFKMAVGTGKAKEYDLNVIDGSHHGLCMLVTSKDIELIKILNTGDKIPNMSFFAKWAMITVDGTIRHKTKIDKGKYKDGYLVGIEAGEIIENCKPPAD